MNDQRHRVRWRWVGLGLMLLQLGWVFAIPPFAAMDEWDHAYRASAVAHGQWVAPPSDATRGTGAYVRVPSDIVIAARAECQRLNYGGEDECIGTPDGEFTEVASGAGRYPPLFYAVVGSPSTILDGAPALYGMRVVGLLLCWGLLLATFRSLARWTGPIAGLTVGLGLTPTVIYASATVAPNGLEMASGLALWAALAAIAHERADSKPDGLTIMLAVVSGSLLLSLRSLGPLWTALILAGALLVWPTLWSRLLGIARSRLGVGALSWLVAVAIGSVWWIQTQGSLVVGADATALDLGGRLVASLREAVIWTFQFMGTFPYRNNPAPPAVYLCLLVVICGIGVFALRYAAVRERWTLTLIVLVSYGIPFWISVATMERFGPAWQGRYTLPFLLGTLVIAGVVLARRLTTPRPWLLVAALASVTIAHTVSLVAAQRLERQILARTSTDWEVQLHPALLALLGVVGCVALLAPFVRVVSKERSP